MIASHFFTQKTVIVLFEIIYKFPGEYYLNVSNQLEYKTSACCFLKLFFLFQI